MIAERFKFYQRKQKDGETISQFIGELKKLADTCEFGAFLEDALRDRLVCGLTSTAIQRKLLTEDKLKFNKAVEIALGMEAADKHAGELQKSISASASTTGISVHKVHGECFRCGRSGHDPDNCFHKNVSCHFCEGIGHLSRMCVKKKSQGARQKFVEKPKWKKI